MPYNTACFYRMGLTAEQFKTGAIILIGPGNLAPKAKISVVNVFGTPNGVTRFLARYKGQFWKATFDSNEDELLLEQGAKPCPIEELRQILGVTSESTFVDEDRPWGV